MFKDFDDTNEGNIDENNESLTQSQWIETVSKLKDKMKFFIDRLDRLDPSEASTVVEVLQRLLYMDQQSKTFDVAVRSALEDDDDKGGDGYDG